MTTALEKIKDKVRGRAQIVAVSKTKSVQQILEVYHQGQKTFGENYVQELIEKSNELRSLGIRDVDFHFVGHLQSNKVKMLLPHVSTIHAVDSLKLLLEVEKQAKNLDWNGRVFLQVNIDREHSKSGFAPENLHHTVEQIPNLVKKVKVVGLMCIPNPQLDPTDAFQRLAKLRDQHKDIVGSELSMGMSDDYEVAIAAGSTVIRIGSAIFGARS